MNKREYMERILDLCTKDQKDLFKRMYPSDVDNSRVQQATNQIELTLKKSLVKESEYVNYINNLKKTVSKLNDTICELKEEIVKLKKTEISIELKNDSDLLNALVAEGVDNWDGYDYAIDRLKEGEG